MVKVEDDDEEMTGVADPANEPEKMGTTEVPDTPALKKMKVGDLRALLEERGLDSTGKKDLLVERLEAVRGKGGAAGLNTTA